MRGSSISTIVRSRLFRRYFLSYVLAVLLPVAAAVMLVGLSVLSDLRERDEIAHEALLTDLARFSDYRLERLVESMTTVTSQGPIRRLSSSRTDIDPSADPVENFEIILSRQSLREQLIAILRLSEFVRSVFVVFGESETVLTAEGRYSHDEFFSTVHRPVDVQEPLPWERSLAVAPIRVGLPYTVERRAPVGDAIVARYTAVPVSVPYPLVTPGKALLVAAIDAGAFQSIIAATGDYPVHVSVVSAADDLLVEAGEYEQIRTIRQSEIRTIDLKSQVAPIVYVSRAQIADITASARQFQFLMWGFAVTTLILGLVYAYRLSFQFYAPVLSLQRLFENAGVDDRDSSTATTGEIEIVQRWAETVLHEHEIDQQRLRWLQPLAHADLLRRSVAGAPLDEQERSIFQLEVLPVRILFVFVDPLTRAEHGWDRRALDNAINVKCWYSVGACGALVALATGDSKAEAVDQFHREICGRLVGFRITIGVGPGVRDGGAVTRAAAEARDLAELRSLSPEHEVVTAAVEHTDASNELFLSDTEATKLANLARLADVDVLKDELERLIRGAETRRAPERATKAFASDLIAIVFRAAGVRSDPNYEMGRFVEWTIAIERSYTASDIIAQLKLAAEELCRPAVGPSDHEEAIARAVHYINEHYSEALSVTFFSEMLSMSPGHFSRTFKAVTGCRYVDYVNQVRLTHAKDLLSSTTLRIDEISGRVGYVGANSFSAIFKKYEAVTPGQFRHSARARKIQ